MAVQERSFQSAQPVVEREQGLEFYLAVIRRRWAFFLIPFAAVLILGTLVAMLLPPLYRSEARILVQSQQIPLDLVQSTVTASAEERIEVITQRIMTRNHLKSIVDKFKMFPRWRGGVSNSDLVDLMRDRTSVTPVALSLRGSPNRRAVNSTMAFTVAFEYENPKIAARVANELVTLILNEDVRARKSRAADTSRFLAQEVERLEQDQLAVESKIAQFKVGSTNFAAQQLAALKTALLEKSIIYSGTHPEIIALKDRIRALESGGQGVAQGDTGEQSSINEANETRADSFPPGAAATNDETPEGTTLTMLENKAASLEQDLDRARQKLLVARRGERLEEDLQSERFEVIEQPTLPEDPVKPNRKKILAMTFALAVVAGFAGVFAMESFDKTIRGTADLPVPAGLVVAIPYISTHEELAQSRKTLKIALVAGVFGFILLLVLIHFLVLPLDLAFEKLTHRLLGP
jgi:uncharacterized protein involved in exopolysaccharide biosynthesis